MNEQQRIDIITAITDMLRTVFDPEIPADIYSLGLVYGIDVSDQGAAHIKMTLTAPGCPMADFIMEDVRQKVRSVQGVTDVDVELVFEPEWTPAMMSEEARLELGMM